MADRERSSVILGASLFALSTVWLVRKIRRERSSDSGLQFEQLYRRLTRHERIPIKDADHSVGEISSRGQSALSPPIPYLSNFLVCLQNPCDPARNPKGHIPMCVAENRLVLDMLAERFMQVGTATATFSDSSVYCYNSFLGMPVAREAAAYFLARRFLYPDDPDLAPDVALQHVHPNHVALGAGGAALLSNLFFLLGETGDACLIPAPYYAAFENDMNLVAGVQPVGIVQADPMQGPTDAELDRALARAKSVRWWCGERKCERYTDPCSLHTPCTETLKAQVCLAHQSQQSSGCHLSSRGHTPDHCLGAQAKHAHDCR